MPDDIQFNFSIPPVPEGEALTFEEIEKRLKGHLEEKGGRMSANPLHPHLPRLLKLHEFRAGKGNS
ncbi:MAG: hypothetical protein VCA73_07480 [Roseibacillus sp.]|jgi:hypothetical protein